MEVEVSQNAVTKLVHFNFIIIIIIYGVIFQKQFLCGCLQKELHIHCSWYKVHGVAQTAIIV
jgi:hypothetical protein